jgi:hypothetical protein
MVSPQKIRFEFGQASLTSKVIDGAFPDYMRVIPKGNDKQADIDNALFAQAVDRVATISAEKSRSVKLAFELDRVTLTVRNMEAGQGVEEVEIGYSEEPFEIGFNARYLPDVAGQITGETAHFICRPGQPTLVLDPGDPGVQYVLMPLRVCPIGDAECSRSKIVWPCCRLRRLSVSPDFGADERPVLRPPLSAFSLQRHRLPSAQRIRWIGRCTYVLGRLPSTDSPPASSCYHATLICSRGRSGGGRTQSAISCCPMTVGTFGSGLPARHDHHPHPHRPPPYASATLPMRRGWCSTAPTAPGKTNLLEASACSPPARPRTALEMG